MNIITRGLGKAQSLITRGFSGFYEAVVRFIRDAGGLFKRKSKTDDRIQTNLIRVTPMLRAKLRYLDVEVDKVSVRSFIRRIEATLQRQQIRKRELGVSLRR